MVVISHLDLPHLRLSSRDLNGALPPTCHVRVLATEALRSATLHAEGDATQLSVHYLLPLLWLTEGAAAVDWARGHAADRQGHKARDGRASSVPRAIARLKAALRDLPISPYISLHLPTSPYISLYLVSRRRCAPRRT